MKVILTSAFLKQLTVEQYGELLYLKEADADESFHPTPTSLLVRISSLTTTTPQIPHLTHSRKETPNPDPIPSMSVKTRTVRSRDAAAKYI